MASSLPSFSALSRLTFSHKVRMQVRPRAQVSGDEGKSPVSNVDAYIGVLKERVEIARVRQRLQKRLDSSDGWYYLSRSQYDPKFKKDALKNEYLEVAELVLGTFGLTIVGCTLCLCLFSFVVHLA